MNGRLGLLGLITLVLATTNLGLAPEVSYDPVVLMLTIILIAISDALAVRTITAGSLSNAFLWLLPLAQVCGSRWATLVLMGTSSVRWLLLEKGSWNEQRPLSVFVDCNAALAAFLALTVMPKMSPQSGFPMGLPATLLALLAYYVVGVLSLTWAVSHAQDSEASRAVEQKTRVRHFRGLSMIAPVVTLLAALHPLNILWAVPMIFAVRSFSWNKVQEFQVFEHQAKITQSRLKSSKQELEVTQRDLHHTVTEKELHRWCLERFTEKKSLNDIARASFELSKKFVVFETFAVFLDGEHGFAPLGFYDFQGREVPISSETFPDKAILSRCWSTQSLAQAKGENSLALPIAKAGVLYLGRIQGELSKEDLSKVQILANNAAFGFHSAGLFETITDSLERESQAKEETHLALAQLKESQEQVLQASKMSAVGNLAAGIAHEVNTPLASILVAVEGASRSLKRDKIDSALSKLTHCKEATLQAKAIVEQFLSFARNGELVSETFKLGVLFDEVFPLLNRPLTERSIHLDQDIDPQFEISGSRIQLGQIITNLVLNAKDALEQSSSDHKKIGISSQANQDCLEIIVTDNGPGVPLEIVDRIFEPFFTSKQVGRGTGLGLYVCREIAQRHGGQLRLEQEPGQGARFVLTLPAA